MAIDISKRLGLTFGSLKMIRPCCAPESSRRKDKNSCRWVECLCACGKTHVALVHKIISGNTKSCGCLNHPSGERSPCFRGHKEISLAFYSQIRNTALGGTSKRKRTCKEFNLSIEDMWELFIKQKRRCALSGVELYFHSRSERNDGTASLDRIDSNKNYEIGNVQWVHKHVNIMKNAFPQEYFLDFCEKITRHVK